MSDSKSIEQEPSIEEILASIRQIISDDDEVVADNDDDSTATAEEDVKAEEPADVIPEPLVEKEPAEETEAEPADKTEDDILDLTNIVTEEPEMSEAPKEENPVEENEDSSEEASTQDIDDIFAAGDDDIDFGEIDTIDDTPMTDISEDVESEGEELDGEVLEEEESDFPANAEDENSFANTDVEDPFSLITKDTAGAVEESIAKLASSIKMANNPGYTLEDIVREMLKPMLREWLDNNLPLVIEKLVQEELEKIIKKTMK